MLAQPRRQQRSWASALAHAVSPRLHCVKGITTAAQYSLERVTPHPSNPSMSATPSGVMLQAATASPELLAHIGKLASALVYDGDCVGLGSGHAVRLQ